MGLTSREPRGAGIPRPRLAVRLDAAAEGRLTLVVAGPGYGKTTALRSWAEANRAAWHTLTAADRMPSTLARHLVDALRLRVPDLSADLVVAATKVRGHDTDELSRAEASAAAMADALATASRRRLVLVLDDIDQIAGAAEAERLVAALVRQAPSTLHIVLAGRMHPAMRTSRLLAHGEATEIGTTDLAFTRDEVDQLVRSRIEDRDAQLAARVSTHVHRVSGGWPVATRLAVEAVAAAGDGDVVLQNLGEPSGLLVDYMVDEVVANDDPRVVALLESCAPLSAFDAELAAYVGVPDAARVLSTAVRRGVYVELAAGRQGRFVLTPLCRSAIGRRAPRALEEPTVLRAAAQWHESHGEAAEALRYLVRLGAVDEIRRLLESRGSELVSDGEAALTIDALDVVPQRQRTPALEQLAGDARLLLGEWDAALETYRRAVEPSDAVPARIAWRVGLVHYMCGELDDAAKAFDAADPSDPDLASRALATAWSASVCWLRGDLAACRSRTARALADARAARDHRALANAHTVAAMLAALDGDRGGNDAHYLQALDHAMAARDVLQLVRIHSNRASHHIEEAEALDAVTEADTALRLADVAGFASFRAMALTNRGQALTRLGRLDEAKVELEGARTVFERIGSPMAAYAHAALGDVHRLRGDTGTALACYQRAVTLARDVGDLQGLVPALTGAARLLAADDVPAARDHVRRALDAGPSLAQVEALLAAARVELADGAVKAAAELAERALGRARTQRDRAAAAEAHEILATVRQDVVAATEAVDVWEDLGDPLGLARARVVVAELERSAEAIDLAAAAVEHALQLGAHGVANPALRRLDELRAVTAPEVRVMCLGEFVVIRDRRPVPVAAWQSRKAREALRLLVCRGGRAVSREQLAEALWPNEDPAKTANRLSVALSTVRTVLDPDRRHPAEFFVRADGETVALDLTHVDVDVERFLTLSGTGLAWLRSGRHVEARSRLQVAEVLYAGDLFEDDPYQDWCVDLRERARLTYLDVARALAELAVRQGDRAAAARYLLRILERDPFDERAHLDLVRVLAGDGRHGEARRRYRMYCRRMEEIDVEAAPYPDGEAA